MGILKRGGIEVKLRGIDEEERRLNKKENREGSKKWGRKQINNRNRFPSKLYWHYNNTDVHITP